MAGSDNMPTGASGHNSKTPRMKEENPEETIPAVAPQTVDADMLPAAEAQAADDVEKDAYEGHDSGVAVAEDDFDNLGIEPPILKAVKELGFVRCDNITVGYTWPSLLKETLRLRLYGAVQKPFVITGYKGIDPEIYGGIDRSVYPRPVSFTVGVIATF